GVAAERLDDRMLDAGHPRGARAKQNREPGMIEEAGAHSRQDAHGRHGEPREIALGSDPAPEQDPRRRDRAGGEDHAIAQELARSAEPLELDATNASIREADAPDERVREDRQVLPTADGRREPGPRGADALPVDLVHRVR